MARRWRDSGADVTVITGMPNRPQGRIYDGYRGRIFMEEDWEGIRVLRSWLFARPHGGFLQTLLNNSTFMIGSTIDALARARPFDVIIASSPPFFPHIAGSVVHRLTGVPLILEIRDLWPDYLVEMGTVKSPFAQRRLFGLEKSLLMDATRVVVVTESFRRRVATKGVPFERIETISNGIDPDIYFPADDKPPLPELTPEAGGTVVGYLGNMGAGQALDVVLEAAALIERQGAPIRFVLTGDGPERATLEVRARALGLRSLTLTRTIPKDATRAFYNSCDICMVPLAPLRILTETVPSKLFEVMACERPLIATVAGEAARIVSDSGGGWVTPPGDPAALADAVVRMAALPPAERRALGTRGGRYVRQHYLRADLADRYLRLLTEAARSRHASPQVVT